MAIQNITGEICMVSGIYKTIDHDIEHPKEITMVKDDKFPPCRKCNKYVKYELIRKTEH